MRAWNGWYHVNGNTYGTWLRGDPRGWRSRRHRRHVEGDYLNPPPKGSFDQLYEQSKRLMARPSVRLNKQQRCVAGRALVGKLIEEGIELLALSLDATHYHILARFPDKEVRTPVGMAKKNASHILSNHGLIGTVWAKRCRPLPITDRSHQLNVYRYIIDHAKRGAWVWTFKEGVHWLEER